MRVFLNIKSVEINLFNLRKYFSSFHLILLKLKWNSPPQQAKLTNKITRKACAPKIKNFMFV